MLRPKYDTYCTGTVFFTKTILLWFLATLPSLFFPNMVARSGDDKDPAVGIEAFRPEHRKALTKTVNSKDKVDKVGSPGRFHSSGHQGDSAPQVTREIPLLKGVIGYSSSPREIMTKGVGSSTYLASHQNIIQLLSLVFCFNHCFLGILRIFNW